MLHRCFVAPLHRPGGECRRLNAQNVKFLSQIASTPQQAVNEGKFTPAPEKNIFLTWEKNFLSEVGIFGAFQKKAVSKILMNCKSLGNYILYSNMTPF